MERLNSRDAEYGTIEGLIASNVGDSTLAVSNHPLSIIPIVFSFFIFWSDHHKYDLCYIEPCVISFLHHSAIFEKYAW